jgi:hypothetical protein
MDEDPVRAFLSRWVQADGRTILAIGAGRRADGTRKFFHVGFDGGDVDGAADRAWREDARGRDVYLALARYGAATDAKGRPLRTQDNAFGCSSFQADVDVKAGGYDTVEWRPRPWRSLGRRRASASRTLACVRATACTSTGSFDGAVPKDRWHPLAAALTAALLAQGLRFDTACTKDIARILRVPGTRNWKDPNAPKPVSLLWDRGLLGLEAFADALAQAAPRAAADDAPNLPFRPHVPANDGARVPGSPAGPDELGGGKVGRKVDLAVVRRECLILADAVDTGGEAHGEPLWRDLLLLTIFGDEPGDDTAHAISVKHPDYSASETDAKLALLREQRGRSIDAGTSFGPPTCGRLDQLWRGQFGANPHCAACPHRGHIKSPAYAPDRTGAAR